MRLPVISIVFAACISAALLLNGCAVHRSQPPVLPVTPPETYGGAPEAAMEPAQMSWQPDARWWEAFGDQALNAIMDRLMAANLDLAQALARLKQADALLRQSGADRWPAMSLNGSAARSQQLQAGGATIGDSWSLSAAASFEVDLWNKLSSRAQARQLETIAAEGDVKQLFLSLTAEAADLYYLMVEQRAQLVLIDQTVAAREANLALVERRFREGLVTALDLYQARQVLAAAHSQRPAVEARLATSAHALAVLTAGYPTTAMGGSLAVLPDLPAAFPLGLPSALLEMRPDIQASLGRLRAADMEIGVAAAARFPSINLVADYGRSGSDMGTSLTGTVWNLAANLAMPIVDWGKRKAEVERSEAVFEERLAAYQHAVLNAFKDVENALVDDRSATVSIERISVETAAAKDALRLSTDRYMDGLSDYLPVLTAQTTLFDSQSRLLTARRQLISARISLARALGGHWMAEALEKRLLGAGDTAATLPQHHREGDKRG